MDRILLWLLAQFLTAFVWVCQLVGLGQHWAWALTATIDIGEHFYISACAGLLVWLSTWWITLWPLSSMDTRLRGRISSTIAGVHCTTLLRYSLVLLAVFLAHLWHDGLWP